MKISQWPLLLGMILLVGCSPKSNDGLTPNQPAYTNVGYPSPLALFNGYLAAGASLNVFEYSPNGLTDATATPLAGDTSVAPWIDKSNLMDALTAYKDTTWVGFPILGSPTIDLTANNFTQLTFYVKAAFASGTTITSGQVGFNGLGVNMTPVTVTTAWQYVSLPISGSVTGPVTAMSELFCSNFYSVTIAAPVTTYYDQIQFQ